MIKNQLVECIPNFSEGRRTEVIDAITNAIEAVPGVLLLGRSSDRDHNRSVITFVGSPDAVCEAAFRAIAKAAELINLEDHQGQHPRIGATDVVPFVPLKNMTIEECAALARTLGQRVGEELNIPVYLYEVAATHPDRTNLENIRRGNYEGLKSAVQTDPSRLPDFGPAQLGSAGATVIGARAPLIAFNVYLTTDDVEIARKIAVTVRHSSGGLRFVKALGLLVDGHAQVSMNLTDFTRTPIPQVVEMIRREAARYGTTIHHSELVGMIPQMALIDAARWYLQLDQFSPNQILETRLNDLDSNDSGYTGVLGS
jgi:glutamate formiminotransferase